MSEIQLIVGLGNPGPEYQHTRHNAGSWFVEELARIHNAPLTIENKFLARTARVFIQGKEVRLMIPTTYMNLSGQAVSKLANFYRIPAENILVAFDELDLPAGVAKFKTGGSSSQNGIRDIVAKMANNKNFHRLRIGIDHPGDKNKVTGHVLGKASAQDQQKIDAAIDEAVRCTDILFKDGLTKAMNRLHSFKAE
ncbi:aminoacyl-tRNA hydrolase [Neptunicella marina]|uniref:Peptidyl-tRNA hydrolase n=1 Tax=Neptunicella marina TaxID=2125989 RepID=A0A8J6IPS6_9ALTE|nr:aminoacyl-tRNA hydrolase [Neptunicella marina]MBC3764369.1 aminoacyl-tRNA hydrolase [Neptunicella marina]